MTLITSRASCDARKIRERDKANNGGKEESKHERQGDRAGQRDRAIKVGVGQGSHIARQGGREVSKQ